jgi:hypothetical protein
MLPWQLAPQGCGTPMRHLKEFDIVSPGGFEFRVSLHRHAAHLWRRCDGAPCTARSTRCIFTWDCCTDDRGLLRSPLVLESWAQEPAGLQAPPLCLSSSTHAHALEHALMIVWAEGPRAACLIIADHSMPTMCFVPMATVEMLRDPAEMDSYLDLHTTVGKTLTRRRRQQTK